MNLKNGISVIIPTFNRSELLRLSLKSLQFQTCEKHKYEIIVIDDGSTDDTKEIVDHFRQFMDVQYLYQDHRGFRVAKARNLGIFSAKFNACLFLDSGMLASPELIEVHLKAHEESKKEIAYIGYALGFDEFNESCFLGNVEFNNQDDLYRIIKLACARREFRDCRESGLQKLGLSFGDLSVPWLLFWTCHASCATSTLRVINGFDENFQSWGGEDIELAIRIQKSQVKIDHLPHALAIHLPHQRSTDENKVSGHKNSQYIYQKHPSTETQLLAKESSSWEKLILDLHSLDVYEVV